MQASKWFKSDIEAVVAVESGFNEYAYFNFFFISFLGNCPNGTLRDGLVDEN